MKSHLSYRMRRSQFYGLAILGLILLLLEGSFFLFKKKSTFPEKASLAQFYSKKSYTPFDPNKLNLEQWQELGFTQKQAETILKYKEKILKGTFRSKEEVAACYAISDKKFQELSPYLLLPEKSTTESQKSQNHKKLNIKKAFDPNTFTLQDWVNIGFSERQAESLMKYKNYLGGKFTSKENLKEAYVISPEIYRQMEAYLLLPNSSSGDKIVKKTSFYQKYFDPNTLDKEGWMALGFTEKQANSILKYKEKVLNGRFSTLEEIKKCYVISEQKFEELKPWIRFEKPMENKESSSISIDKIELNSVNFDQLISIGFSEKAASSFLGFRKILGGFMDKNQILEAYYIDKNLAQKLIDQAQLNIQKVPKINLLTADENTLKRHPYFRKHADKIIFYRVSFPDKKEILNHLKVNDQELSKMNLYLD